MISIAMATYNGEKYLREQLDSILAQTYTDFELVICDDCSTDNTVAILREYEKKDNRIKVFENDQNLGFKKNFEKVVTLCTGEYTAFSDQDDIWFENHLEVLLDLLKNNKCDVAGANCVWTDEYGNPIKNVFNDKAKSVTASKIEMMLLYHNLIQGCCMMAKTDFLKNCLPIPNGFEFHDLYFALVACSTNGCIYSNIPVIKYRRHGSQYTVSKIDNNSKLLAIKESYMHDAVFFDGIKMYLGDKVSNVNLKKLERFFYNLTKKPYRSFLFYIFNFRKLSNVADLRYQMMSIYHLFLNCFNKY